MTLAGKRIELIGDSWVAGASGDALVAELVARGAVVQKDGVVGSSAVARAARATDLRSAIHAFAPTDVIYVLGVNDVVGDRTAAAYLTLASLFPRSWVLSNATLEGSEFRTKVQQIERLQRAAFDGRAIAGATFASPSDFDTTRYHLTAEGARAWGAFVAGVLELQLDTDLSAQLGRGLLRSLPLAEGFLGRFGGR